MLAANVAVKTTGLIAQYLSIKQKVADAILFFRLGDFYEMFFEDAEVASRILDIQLTSRSREGAPLCGVPYHSAEPYIAKLLKAGHKVAICEQTPTGATRGLMPRQIVRIITPGTVNDEMVLSADEKNYLSAVVPAAEGFGLASVDVSTGEFRVTQLGNSASLLEEIRRLGPREVLAAPQLGELAQRLTRLSLTRLDDSYWEPGRGAAALTGRFGASSACLPPPLAAAAGAAMLYLEQTFGAELGHLRPPELYQASQYLQVDEVSRSHLELVVSSDGSRQGSLLSIVDQTRTAAGARTLASWLLYPLLDIDAIHRRQDAIEELFEADLGGAITAALGRIGDLERLVGRVASLKAGPRDCLKLRLALEAAGDLKQAFGGFRSEELCRCAAEIDPLPEVSAQIAAAISDEPPMTARDGGVIRAGFHAGADELRTLSLDARSVIARLETRERERTGIGSLKVRYNQVFGYYLEITKAHLERAPADYERKQTLVGAERYTTPELKELERKILSAESGLKELEAELFLNLLRSIAAHAAALARTARAVGQMDCLVSLAQVARRRGYVRPIINNGTALSIIDGRHPVLEANLKRGEFVPNDLEADPENRQLLLITGPNMAGKSTYLRQVALIVIMAQAGSFVPATQATLGLVDRIFTRIGARDDLRRGESTFMVEMRETARLLSGLGERSLLLLDEVGRGTSTFDGLAIAWSLAEYLHDRTRARILFATHFHELTDLARERPRVKNLCMAVREWGGDVVFLRRVVEGAASRSYGIEVAKLAGLPESLILRAREILNNLEQGELDANGMPRLARGRNRGVAQARQMDLFTPAERRALDELKALDPDRLTPIEALNALNQLSRGVRGEK
ncbi:MAG TPA: DNA mismatch repair protein MutS [Candidatus Binataceae bacterium]